VGYCQFDGQVKLRKRKRQPGDEPRPEKVRHMWSTVSCGVKFHKLAGHVEFVCFLGSSLYVDAIPAGCKLDGLYLHRACVCAHVACEHHLLCGIIVNGKLADAYGCCWLASLSSDVSCCCC
jgi:hypothetical protein